MGISVPASMGTSFICFLRVTCAEAEDKEGVGGDEDCDDGDGDGENEDGEPVSDC
jgi:hypothetical protein